MTGHRFDSNNSPISSLILQRGGQKGAILAFGFKTRSVESRNETTYWEHTNDLHIFSPNFV